ncbi:MAG TPA: hypothetical protein DCZ10_11330 [Pelotomaculum sp.]|nr:hypothetical protein [Pelotomaculum sp.]
MERATVYQNWNAKQQVQIKELPGIWAIDYFTVYTPEFVQARCTKLKRDGTRTKFNSSVSIEKLMQLDEKQPTIDKNGLTAAEYAQQVFGCGYAITDFYCTTCESIVKVLSISKAGRVKVQPLIIKQGVQQRVEHRTPDGHKIYSQEDQIVNWAELGYEEYGEPVTYSPRLHDGKWGYWHESKYLKPAKMRLTQLLD